VFSRVAFNVCNNRPNFTKEGVDAGLQTCDAKAHLVLGINTM